MIKTPTTDSELRKIVTNRMSLLQAEDHHIRGISSADEARLEHYIDEIMQLITRSNQLAALEARIDETEHSAVQRSIDAGFGVSEYEAFMTVDAKKRRAELTQARDAMVKEGNHSEHSTYKN